VLEEIEVPQPLGLCVMDRVRAFDTGRCEPAAADKVDADRQHLSRRIKIDASDVPRFADAERRFEKLVLHIREPFAAKAECRTMPAFSLARLSGPAGAVKGSLRRASPALDCASRDTLTRPQPTRISKEAFLAALPLATGFLLDGETVHVAMGCMAILFVAAVTFAAQHFNRAFVNGVRANLNLNEQTKELTKRTEDLTGANSRLEAEIAQRRAAEDQLHQAQKMEAL